MSISSGITMGLYVAAMFALFVVLFTLLLHTIARLSGWKKLAAIFPARPPAPQAKAGHGSVCINKTSNYTNCFKWVSDEEHLHLRLTGPFSIGHPPISIPWAAIEIVYSQARKRGLAQIKIEAFTLGIPPEALTTELELRKELASTSTGQRATQPYSSDRIS